MNTSRFLFALALLPFCSLAASAQPPPATLKVLYSFPCNGSSVCPDGYFPIYLTEGADGSFYGVASGGGTGTNSQGTVFKITSTGQFSLIYSFAEHKGGSLPYGASPGIVIEGTDGFLYGTALVDGRYGQGTVFKLSKTGTIQNLHDFCSTPTCTDGANPSFLTQGIDGKFYGVTANLPPSSVLYSLTAAGAFNVLHTFDTSTQSDGTGSFGFLQASDGNYYGTTVAGIQNATYNSVFRFNPKSGVYQILHGFNWPNVAQSGLAQSSTGELYGLQTNSILYQISTTGAYQELGSLATTKFADGHILLASDGNLWGDFQGGDCGLPGIVFDATTSGTVLQEVSFNCKTQGQQLGRMFQAADGKFYGVTYGSGVATTNSITNGTIWSIDAGLPPPAPTAINFVPASGAVGTTVLLQGAHFVGTTAVLFNGVGAAFRLLTVDYLRVVVPPGATTGTISVTNAGGTTTYSKVFVVP